MFFLFALAGLMSFSEPPSSLRKLLPLAAKGEPYARALIHESAAHHNQRVARAYRAVAVMTLAKYAALPREKFRLFTEGRALLDSCVSADTLDPETRFLRLTVQRHVPRFLNYHRDMAGDQAFVTGRLRSLKQSDPELAAMITEFFKN